MKPTQLATAVDTARFLMQACNIHHTNQRWHDQLQKVAVDMTMIAGLNKQQSAEAVGKICELVKEKLIPSHTPEAAHENCLADAA